MRISKNACLCVVFFGILVYLTAWVIIRNPRPTPVTAPVKVAASTSGATRFTFDAYGVTISSWTAVSYRNTSSATTGQFIDLIDGRGGSEMLIRVRQIRGLSAAGAIGFLRPIAAGIGKPRDRIVYGTFNSMTAVTIEHVVTGNMPFHNIATNQPLLQRTTVAVWDGYYVEIQEAHPVGDTAAGAKIRQVLDSFTVLKRGS